MNRYALKNFLIAEGLCLDNEYLNMYLDLLETNLTREAEAKSTQCHHAIPVCYYKKRDNSKTRYAAKKAAEADSLNVTVNLLYSDHLLAHAYLVLCADSDWFKYINANIFGYFTKVELSESLLTLINSSEFQAKYEEGYELRVLNSTGSNNGFYGRRLTEEHKEKIRTTKKRNFELGLHKPNKRTAEEREKIGASKRGKIYISSMDGSIAKLIMPDELEDYLADGWVRGFALAGKDKVGKRYSEEHRQKISTGNKGKHSVAIACIELDKTFPSVRAAACELNLRPNAISNCLTGVCKTCGGYHWRYVK